jgi:hypothetical protein
MQSGVGNSMASNPRTGFPSTSEPSLIYVHSIMLFMIHSDVPLVSMLKSSTWKYRSCLYPVFALHSRSSCPEFIRPHFIVQPFPNSLLASIYADQFQSNSTILLECADLR